MRLLKRPFRAMILGVTALAIGAGAAAAGPRQDSQAPAPSQSSGYVNGWNAVMGYEPGGEALLQQEVLLPRPRGLLRELDRRGYDVVALSSYTDRLATVSVCAEGKLQDLEISAPFTLRFVRENGDCPDLEAQPAPQLFYPPRVLYLD